MNPAEEFFNELMYGQYGAWFGFVLIVAIIVLVSAKTKIGGIAMLPIGLFIGIEYMNNVATNSNFFWSGIIMLILCPILAIYSTHRLVKG